MLVSLIVAMDESGLIGAQGGMPWHLPAELKHFRRMTMGKALLMGRKTHESIGKPLPGRRNIILTRDSNYNVAGCETAASLEEALTLARQGGADELVVIGGAQVYALCLPRVQRIYLTRVQGTFDGDTWFPALDMAQWEQLAGHEHPADDEHAQGFSCVTLHRRELTRE